jgi:hypothetical protein
VGIGVNFSMREIFFEIDMLEMHLDKVKEDIHPPYGRSETLVER